MNSISKAIKAKVGDVLSAPIRVKHHMRGKVYDAERAVIKKARGFDGARTPDATKTKDVASYIKKKYGK